MEVKVHCPCGTRYKFDVEPINDCMPGPVSCPTCGADGTPASNAIIQQSVNAQLTAGSAGGGQPASAEKPQIRLHIPSQSSKISAPAVAPMAQPTTLEPATHLAGGSAASLAAPPPRERAPARSVSALAQPAV